MLPGLVAVLLGGKDVCAANAANPVTVVIDTIPSGARVELKGATLGTTPLRGEYPKTYLMGPAHESSKRLEAPAVMTFYKAGYYPKTVELTHGPFTWRSPDGQNAFNYYTLDPSYMIRLEPLPGAAPDRPGARGTAFHCHHNGYLVTTYDVVEGHDTVRLSKGDKGCAAAVAGTDKANDLAILQVDADCIQALGLGEPLPLGSSSGAAQGQEVVTYGAESGGEPQLSAGTIKRTAGLDADPRAFTISNSIQPAASGGPLLGRDGAVIGVVTSTFGARYLYPKYQTLPQDSSFAIKSEYVRLLFQLRGIDEDATLAPVGAPSVPVNRVQSSVVSVTAPSPERK